LINPNTTEAKCLDGTPVSFYFVKGHGDGLNKTVFYFEGGGWCYGRDLQSTLNDCAGRATSNLGSSKNDPVTANYDAAVSGNPNMDPNFASWNRIYVRYCDGTGH
jgi:hypothetical protein